MQTIELTDGTNITTPLLITTLGVKPALGLAEQAGLKIDCGALVVDKNMRTSNTAIYAGGDIVRVLDKATGIMTKSTKWGDAMKQGKVAALNIIGNAKCYEGAFIGYRTSFFGIDFIMGGLIKNYPATYSIIVKKGVDDQGNEFYHKLVLDNSLVKGFLLINDTAQGKRLRTALQDQMPIDVRCFLKRYKQ